MVPLLWDGTDSRAAKSEPSLREGPGSTPERRVVASVASTKCVALSRSSETELTLTLNELTLTLRLTRFEADGSRTRSLAAGSRGYSHFSRTRLDYWEPRRTLTLTLRFRPITLDPNPNPNPSPSTQEVVIPALLRTLTP